VGGNVEGTWREGGGKEERTGGKVEGRWTWTNIACILSKLVESRTGPQAAERPVDPD
jgi:hypothetical protein